MILSEKDMTEIKLRELLTKVRDMSLEEGKQFILSLYPTIEHHENIDYYSGTGHLYDYDFCFEHDLMLTFTAACTKENEIDFDNGYWHVVGD